MSNVSKVKFWVLLGISLCFSHVYAQWHAPRFEHINQEDGLSNENVWTVYQDDRGFIWFGSILGLTLYDGYTLKALRPTNLRTSTQVLCIYQDQPDRLLIGTKRGLITYDITYDRFSQFPLPGKAAQSEIKSILKTRDGSLLISTYGEGLLYKSKDSREFTTFLNDPNNPQSIDSPGVVCLFEDSRGRIWVGTYKGLNLFDPATGHFSRVAQRNGALLYSYAICEDQEGGIWVGQGAELSLVHYNETDGLLDIADERLFPSDARALNVISSKDGFVIVGTKDGFFRFNPSTKEVSHVVHNPRDPYSLRPGQVSQILEDKSGVLWVCVRNEGVSKMDTRQFHFTNLVHNPNLVSSLSGSAFSCAASQDGRIWVGTETGVDCVDPKRAIITEVPITLPSGRVWDESIISLCPDGMKGLWMGSLESGLLFYDFERLTFKQYLHDPNDSRSLSHDKIHALCLDREGLLWVGTDGGLNQLDKERLHFKTYRKEQAEGYALNSNIVFSVHEDKQGIIWVGTNSGLNALDKTTGRVTLYLPQADQASRSDIGVSCIMEARDSSLWVGTESGLFVFDKNRQLANFYNESNGIASSLISNIQEDDMGYMWIGSYDGLDRLDPETGKISHFDVFDGIHGNEFNEGVSFRANNGQLIFGGKNGITMFYPEQVVQEPNPAAVQITGMNVFDRALVPKYEDPSSPLEKVIGETDRVELNYKQNMLTISFSAMNFSNPSKSRYQYILEGNDQQWITKKEPVAVYTNLEPGSYTFKVKAATLHGDWSREAQELMIFIKPPPWATWWAYTFYALVLVMIVWSYIKANQRQLAYEREINAKQNQINLRLRQLDSMKDEILANTSHELRTPLNGIIGLADSLRDGSAGDLSEPVRRDLGTIIACGKRLSSLINDILDYSRLKNQSLTLKDESVDLSNVVDMVLRLSRPLLNDKELKLIQAIPTDLPLVKGDENRLTQVFHNLIGNAIKFTERGYVKVSAKRVGDLVEVFIADTGIGIPVEKVKRIFDVFEQGDSSTIRAFGGTGLGLAITKRLVAMHGDDIRVESTVGVGSTFSFSLKIAGPSKSLEERARPVFEEVETFSTPASPEPFVREGMNMPFKGNILVVDDEPVNRQVLLNYLIPQGYHVTEVSNGADALKILAEKEDFDLVLLDIMMPLLSGYDVCKRLREQYSVNELPVIFLSAKNQTQDLLEGFNVGGNDYLAKPITKAELLARVNTHLELLDVNRNLETKVQERTQELEEKNKKILDQQEALILKQRQLLMQDKMASLGTLTAGVAHEINNPVNFAHGSVQNLIVDLERFNEFFFELAGQDADEEILDSFRQKMSPLFDHSKTILEGTKRISAIVKELQTFSRMNESDVKQVRLVEGIDSTLSLVKSKFANKVRFECEYLDPLVIFCWPAEMNQVFLNLIINACQAIVAKQEANGQINDERLKITTLLQEGNAVVRFEDDGCGIPGAVRTRIFEPFYTTKPVGEGTGLGLSVTYDIVTKHKGWIEVTSELGVGTSMSLFLPLNAKLNEDQA